MAEGGTVSCGFDIVPGDVLFFEWEAPPNISKEEICYFAAWLAS
jgi:hypothetical protein